MVNRSPPVQACGLVDTPHTALATEGGEGELARAPKAFDLISGPSTRTTNSAFVKHIYWLRIVYPKEVHGQMD